MKFTSHRTAAGWAIVSVVVFLLINGCMDPATPPAERVTELRLTAPAQIIAGEGLPLTIEAVGNLGSRPFAGFDGEVNLAVSAGSITPAVVVVDNGRATVDVTLSAAAGVVLVTATGSGAIGSTEIDISALLGLPGDPTGPAVDAIPDLDYIPRAEDYVANPTLSGIATSFNTIAVMFNQGASTAEVNNLLAANEARIVGGIPTSTTGVLVIELKSQTHEELAETLTRIRTNAAVQFAIQDVRLTTDMIPDSHAGDEPPNWVWTHNPFGGNWGLEASRVPQAWNIYEALLKRGNTTVTTGVVDGGFFRHEDLRYGEHFNPLLFNDHGTHVAGTIGAGFSNRKGIDGVTPFANLVVHGRDVLAFTPIMDGIEELAEAGARVINLSMGLSWSTNPADDPLSVAFVSVLGEIFKAFHDDLLVTFEPPLLVVSAGNDSEFQSSPIDARHNGGPQWAGLALGSDHVIVVEAVDLALSIPLQTKRAIFSNGNGDVSAPGVDILSSVGATKYAQFNGTSMAAPHVTGLASYLISIDPSLSNAEIKELIKSNAVPVTDTAGSPAARMDAFASTLDIDFLRGNDTVLRMLVDIDDGTQDGNLRVRPGSEIDFILDDGDGDGGIGDGAIDMADFRRWRDWLHGAEDSPQTTLDGSAEHPKLDVNGNGKVEFPVLERIAPRGDFNGDGRLHPTDAINVAGVFQAEGPQSDLDVLARLFNDPFYDASELGSLVSSGDLHIDLSQLVDSGRFSEIASRVIGPDVADARLHTEDDPTYIYTLPAGTEYNVEVWGLDSPQDTTCVHTRVVELKPSEDIYWDLRCTGLVVEITLAEQIESGTASPLLIRSGFQQDDGSVIFQPNIAIDIAVTGGSVALTNGATDTDGFFSTEVTMGAGSQQLNVFVTARAAGETTVTRATALPLQVGNNVQPVCGSAGLSVMAGAQVGADQCSQNFSINLSEEEECGFIPAAENFSASCFAIDAECGNFISTNASGSIEFVPEFHPVTGGLLSIRASGTVSADFKGELSNNCGQTGNRIGANASISLTFEVVGSPVTARLTGTSDSAAGEGNAARFRVSTGGFFDILPTEAVPTFDEVWTYEPGEYRVNVQLNAKPEFKTGPSVGSFTVELRFGP